jgi:putative transposase
MQKSAAKESQGTDVALGEIVGERVAVSVGGIGVTVGSKNGVIVDVSRGVGAADGAGTAELDGAAIDAHEDRRKTNIRRGSLGGFINEISRKERLWSQPACWRVSRSEERSEEEYTQSMEDIYKIYLHAPPHYFVPNAMYMVTGAILAKRHLLTEDRRKEFFLKTVFEKANHFGWTMEAWAVLHNHYHFVSQAPEDSKTLPKLIRQVHSITAIQLNRWDSTPGRQVWHNYWDSCITYENSYRARLHYVHTNPVKHGLANNAIGYPFCSYKWFVEHAEDNLKAQVLNQPIDNVGVFDSF